MGLHVIPVEKVKRNHCGKCTGWEQETVLKMMHIDLNLQTLANPTLTLHLWHTLSLIQIYWLGYLIQG
jgi:hypothetical protein